jgi:hypothetical protein
MEVLGMKKISREDYDEVRRNFNNHVNTGYPPSLKAQTRSKKRRIFYKNWGRQFGVYEGTIRRIVKSKNYAEYLRLGRENRGNSTKRKTTLSDVYKTFDEITEKVAKPKKYKTTIIATEAVIPDDWIIKDTIKAGHLISYTVEVL